MNRRKRQGGSTISVAILFEAAGEVASETAGEVAGGVAVGHHRAAVGQQGAAAATRFAGKRPPLKILFMGEFSTYKNFNK